ncbi:MAG: DUF1345 domain-containing protein [Candidatus Rokuibacteriota bacterium]|nr:MAG: DUF1345 domain-containing protein [Candidatus Rokubacteria bacterium]
MPLLFRIVRIRPRLFISLGIGALVSVVLTVFTDWRTATRLLVGWDIYVGLYLALVAHLMSGAEIERIRARAAVEDEGQFAILMLTVVAALASLGAIFSELGIGTGRRPAHVVLAALTILLSWAFIHTIFALHYAHEFYDEDIGGGLAFPGGETEPDYWDFVYFSFVIGMTSQVSDVGVTHKEIRRTVAAHGVVSFVFNAALLALTVNIAASAI